MKKAFLIIILFGFPTLLNAQAIKFGFFEMNDVLKAKMTLDEIKSSGVPIDSITPVPKIMDMSEADSLVYIGGTYYEYYTNTNICDLNVIRFDNRITKVVFGEMTFTKETTIEDAKAYFPKDCASAEPIPIYNDPISYTYCSIPLADSKGNLVDAALLLFFSEGKLKRIDFWEPS
jgi:hypothetical protein|tara:strand:+ start:119211 stop:119735 length:525 start_codon:yes stop_codon:yes gene_type:complete